MGDNPLQPGDWVTIPRVVMDRPGAHPRHERWKATVTHVTDHSVSVMFRNPYRVDCMECETLPTRRVHRALPPPGGS